MTAAAGCSQRSGPVARPKQWRALATRLPLCALIYRGGIVLGSILLRLKQFGDTP